MSRGAHADVVLGGLARLVGARPGANRSLLAKIGEQTASESSMDRKPAAADSVGAAAPLSADGLAARMASAAAALERECAIRPSRAQLGAALQLVAGRAVDYRESDSMVPGLLLAATVLGLYRLPLHVIVANDRLARLRHGQLQPALARLGVGSALIEAGLSIPARRRCWQATVVFCSARERALDLLRFGAGALEPSGPPSSGGQGLLRYARVAAETRRAFALIEDIDRIAVDAAMTTVRLRDRSVAAEGEDDLVAVISLRRMLAGYRRLAGIGRGIDGDTRGDLREYGARTVSVGAAAPAPRLRYRLFDSADHAIEALLDRVAALVAGGAGVVVDGLPEDCVDRLAGLRLTDAGVLLADGLEPAATGSPFADGAAACVAFRESLAELAEPLQRAPVPTTLVSLRIDHSRRAWLRRLRRGRAMFGVDAVECLAAADDGVDGSANPLPAMLRRLPATLASPLAARFIDQQQRQADNRHRQSLRALARYERDVDELLAFAG